MTITRTHLLACCAALAAATADPVLDAVREYVVRDGSATLWSDRVEAYLRLLAATCPESRGTLELLADACQVSLARAARPRPDHYDHQAAADRARGQRRALGLDPHWRPTTTSGPGGGI